MGMELEDLRILQQAEEISDTIWEQIERWDYFAKSTIGKQIVRSADSIGANIAESFGRFHFGEKIQFLYYSRGSLYETKYWVNRAKKRKLISDDQAETLAKSLADLARQLNIFIKSLKAQRKPVKSTLKEPSAIYDINPEEFNEDKTFE